jgi:hypothetical protein
MIDVALYSLRPNAIWSLHGFEYSGLEWRDNTQTKPTEEEINVEIEKIINEEDAKEKAEAEAKQSALDKLTKLGLTINEIAALGVIK